jgi:malate dehydrogenase (oxaloacetate-decarboxylating)(NADP+)
MPTASFRGVVIVDHGVLFAHTCFVRLVGQARNDELNAEQKVFARKEDDSMSLVDVMKTYQPTILVGVTAVGGLFTEEIVREMAAHVERPIIFPLSNPTVKAECTAEQAYDWTDGRCVFASGSPFDPVEMEDGRIFKPSQCNNMYIFPGLGLGATLAGATKVTDRMLYVAAEALATFLSEEDLKKGVVFPSLNQIRAVSHKIAVAVVKEAIREGLAVKVSKQDALDLDTFIASKMYYPEYVPLVEKREITI